MAQIVVENFGGQAPKIDPRQLPNELAQSALDCRLDRNALYPLPSLDNSLAGPPTSVASARSMYRWTPSTWLSYNADADFARVSIADDLVNRIVITGGGYSYPVLYSTDGDFRLGLPAPTTAPTYFLFTAPSDANALDVETVSHIVTMVDAYGSEGPPSPPSTPTDRQRDTPMSINLPAIPAGDYNFTGGALKRIYRSNSGTETTEYQFVAEVAYTATTYVDSVPNAELQEICPSLTWQRPPDDNTTDYPNGPMIGVTELPNGVLAGFSFKTLCFSEPFVYHAWPFEYRITFDDEIVGICAISSGCLVVTKKKPYIVTGVHPQSMATIPLDANFTAVNKRGIVDMGAYSIFAAPEGLVQVVGTAATLVTAEIYTYDQWQAFIGTTPTLTGGQFEGKYVLWSIASGGGLVFDPRGGANTLVRNSQNFRCAYYEPLSDQLWVVDAADSNKIKSFARSSTVNLPYTWRSKVFMLDHPVALSCFRIETLNPKVTSASMQVTVNVWADDLQVVTDRILGDLATDATDYVFRLPGGARAKRWEFQLQGLNPVSRFGMFEAPSEAQ